jgi:tetratricopeptide (TPR) repeat protein
MAGIVLTYAEFSLAQRRKASAEQENQMMGRILWGVQESGGGLDKRLLPHFKQIVADLEKYEYPPEVRWAAYDSYGRALLGAGDPQGAILAFSRALQEARLHKSHAVIGSMLHLGMAHSDAGDYTTAVQYFNTVLEADPDNLEAQFALGFTYRKWGLHGPARDTYSGILAKHPQNPAAWEGLGDSHLEAGEFEAARQAFERLASLAGSEELAADEFVRLARCYLTRGDNESARGAIGRADALAPKSAAVQVEIGWFLLQMGDSANATVAFERALGMKPSKEVRTRAGEGLKKAKARK